MSSSLMSRRFWLLSGTSEPSSRGYNLSPLPFMAIPSKPFDAGRFSAPGDVQGSRTLQPSPPRRGLRPEGHDRRTRADGLFQPVPRRCRRARGRDRLLSRAQGLRTSITLADSRASLSRETEHTLDAHPLPAFQASLAELSSASSK